MLNILFLFTLLNGIINADEFNYTILERFHPFINKDCNQLLIVDTSNKSLIQKIIIDHNYYFHRIKKEDSITNNTIITYTFNTNTFNCTISNFNSSIKKLDNRFLSLINKDCNQILVIDTYNNSLWEKTGKHLSNFSIIKNVESDFNTTTLINSFYTDDYTCYNYYSYNDLSTSLFIIYLLTFVSIPIYIIYYLSNKICKLLKKSKIE